MPVLQPQEGFGRRGASVRATRVLEVVGNLLPLATCQLPVGMGSVPKRYQIQMLFRQSCNGANVQGVYRYQLPNKAQDTLDALHWVTLSGLLSPGMLRHFAVHLHWSAHNVP